jgi:hypothetical protein
MDGALAAQMEFRMHSSNQLTPETLNAKSTRLITTEPMMELLLGTERASLETRRSLLKDGSILAN